MKACRCRRAERNRFFDHVTVAGKPGQGSIELGVDEVSGDPYISLWRSDKDNDKAIRMDVSEGRPCITLYDNSQRTALGLTVDVDGGGVVFVRNGDDVLEVGAKDLAAALSAVARHKGDHPPEPQWPALRCVLVLWDPAVPEPVEVVEALRQRGFWPLPCRNFRQLDQDMADVVLALPGTPTLAVARAAVARKTVLHSVAEVIALSQHVTRAGDTRERPARPATAAPAVPQCVTTERLVVTAPDGTPRIELGVDSHGVPAVRLLDDEGRCRASLDLGFGVNTEPLCWMPSIHLSDSAGNHALAISTSDDCIDARLSLEGSDPIFALSLDAAHLRAVHKEASARRRAKRAARRLNRTPLQEVAP